MLAWALRFFWGYWLALLAFWATRADALLAVQDSLVFLLAGSGRAHRPPPRRDANRRAVPPFRYMVGFPVEVLTGSTVRAPDLLTGFAVQFGWLVVAVALFARPVGARAAALHGHRRLR